MWSRLGWFAFQTAVFVPLFALMRVANPDSRDGPLFVFSFGVTYLASKILAKLIDLWRRERRERAEKAAKIGTWGSDWPKR